MSKTESKAQVSDCDVVKKSIRILILVTQKEVSIDKIGRNLFFLWRLVVIELYCLFRSCGKSSYNICGSLEELSRYFFCAR